MREAVRVASSTTPEPTASTQKVLNVDPAPHSARSTAAESERVTPSSSATGEPEPISAVVIVVVSTGVVPSPLHWIREDRVRLSDLFAPKSRNEVRERHA